MSDTSFINGTCAFPLNGIVLDPPQAPPGSPMCVWRRNQHLRKGLGSDRYVRSNSLRKTLTHLHSGEPVRKEELANLKLSSLPIELRQPQTGDGEVSLHSVETSNILSIEQGSSARTPCHAFIQLLRHIVEVVRKAFVYLIGFFTSAFCLCSRGPRNDHPDIEQNPLIEPLGDSEEILLDPIEPDSGDECEFEEEEI